MTLFLQIATVCAALFVIWYVAAMAEGLLRLVSARAAEAEARASWARERARLLRNANDVRADTLYWVDTERPGEAS